MALLILLSDGDGGHTFELADDPVTIGRSKTNTVSIRDKAASRHHAEVVKDGDVWRLRDLDSRNGVLVNGEKADEQSLEDGDVITIGETALRFRAVQSPDRPEGDELPPDEQEAEEAQIQLAEEDREEEDAEGRIALPDLGDLAWIPVTKLDIPWPVPDGPGPDDSPLSEESLVHRPTDQQALLPALSDMMELAQLHLVRRAELYQEVHASLLSASDAGVLWAELLGLVRHLTDQRWAGALLPSRPGKPLRLQLSGEGGHNAEVPLAVLEAAGRSGEVIHWRSKGDDPLPALIAVPWSTESGEGGLLFAATDPISSAEIASLVDLLAGLSLEIGHWWPTVRLRWSGTPRRPGTRPRLGVRPRLAPPPL